MRHDPLTAASNLQPSRPPGNLHAESAPRSGLSKDLDNPHCPSSGAPSTSGTPPSRHAPMKSQGLAASGRAIEWLTDGDADVDGSRGSGSGRTANGSWRARATAATAGYPN